MVRKLDIRKGLQSWIANITAEARKLSKHRAARATQRWGAPAGVALVILILISSFFLPKNDFQKAKDRLLRNPNDFQAQLVLAEKLLTNNQFKEAERALLLAQQRGSTGQRVNELQSNTIFGKEVNSKLEELWQKKLYSDPENIKKLIIAWEKIIDEKPNYRDGYLQLAYLYYKLYKNEKAKEYLQKAIKLDPNYEPIRKMKKILSSDFNPKHPR